MDVEGSGLGQVAGEVPSLFRSEAPKTTAIAVVGDTGVGKSSLINAVLGRAVARTGIGAPVTHGADLYIDEIRGLEIWDFEGFHHGGVDPARHLRQTLREVSQIRRSKVFDAVWYCWSATGHRITNGQRRLVRQLRRDGHHVVGVMTKVRVQDGRVHPTDAAFARILESAKLGLSDPRIYTTAAVDDPWGGYRRHGISALLGGTRALVEDRRSARRR